MTKPTVPKPATWKWPASGAFESWGRAAAVSLLTLAIFSFFEPLASMALSGTHLPGTWLSILTTIVALSGFASAERALRVRPHDGRLAHRWLLIQAILLPLAAAIALWITIKTLPPRAARPFAASAVVICKGAELIAAAAAGWVLWRFQREVLWRETQEDESLCPECGYDLRTAESEIASKFTRCPECGYESLFAGHGT